MNLNTYIKYASILCAMTMASGILAYQIHLINTTDGEIIADIELAGGSAICPNRQMVIAPNSEQILETGACCSQYIRIRGVSGSIQGQTKEMVPPVTGFGISCRSYTMIIRKTIDGALVIEQG